MGKSLKHRVMLRVWKHQKVGISSGHGCMRARILFQSALVAKQFAKLIEKRDSFGE